MPRWHVACDACDAGAWIGPGTSELDAWCEACQRPTALEHPARSPSCPECGAPLTVSEPRFEELYSELQNLAAVLCAWDGDATLLRALLPERPRFLADLNPPPARADDPPALRRGLARLARGEFARAREELESATREAEPASVRAWHALGVARQRSGELAAAESAFGRVLELEPDSVAARLDRGALRARRGAFVEAREDFARAGDGVEARWNRAALTILEAVATTPGLPPPDCIEAARAEAVPPSDYWSDHTVGRLLFGVLLDRALSRRGQDPTACADERVMRAAESELEFETFWDRGLVLLGYALLDMRSDRSRVASSLALDVIASIEGQPFLHGPTGRFVAAALESAREAVRESRPGEGAGVVRPLLDRDDLRRYRIPCARCGSGNVGVDRCEEEAREPEELSR